jgi:putative membrane protein
MTPLQLMTSRQTPLALVIFDCDGVLVDSEPVSNRVVAQALTDLGWPMDAAEANTRFLGMSLVDMVAVIEAHLGRTVGPDWVQSVIDIHLDALARNVGPIAGGIEALHAINHLGLPWRVASNSSHEEMRIKFHGLGITELVAGRLHSHRDVARGKPAPDLFLAAAAAGGATPDQCVVIEDPAPPRRRHAMPGLRATFGRRGPTRRGCGAVHLDVRSAWADRRRRKDLRMTIQALLPFYPWIKALHVISLIAWLSGLFYLPRLFVYHCAVPRGSAESERFKVMERRLMKQIMTPAMIATWVFGILLVLTPGIIDWHAGWWHTKLLMVILMTGFQGAASRWRKNFLEDRNVKSAKFYRIANEVPTVLMVIIVIMVIVKPF